jgi:hypothetical protein
MDLKNSIMQSGPLKVVRKVKSVYSKVGSPDLFASVTLLWVTTIPQKLGNLSKQGMVLILKKVQQVLRTGQTKFYGQVSQARRSLLLKAKRMLKEPEVKLSGNVFKANVGEETVTQIEFKKD